MKKYKSQIIWKCGGICISTIIPIEETIEEKLERMKMDKFKKDYPMFSNIDNIIKALQSGIKIYNNEIIKLGSHTSSYDFFSYANFSKID